VNSYCGKRKRAHRLSRRASVTRLCEVAAQALSRPRVCRAPPSSDPYRTVSREWDSEPTLGQLSGLFILNHPIKCDAQRRRKRRSTQVRFSFWVHSRVRMRIGMACTYGYIARPVRSGTRLARGSSCLMDTSSSNQQYMAWLCETPLCVYFIKFPLSSSSSSQFGNGRVNYKTNPDSTKAPPRGTEVVGRPLPQPFPQCLGDSGSQPSIGAAGVSLARAALCITSDGTAIGTAIEPTAVRV
jgi:hypothetical protein